MTGRATGPPTAAPALRPRDGRPPALPLAVLAATAYLEVRDGRRDASQLMDWVDARTARLLTATVRRHRRRGPRAGSLTLRRLHVDRSRPQRPSIVVVLDDGTRVVPVCVELRHCRDGWTITALATPDDHVPAPADPDQPDWEVPTSVEPW